jgi:hypothetical protein
MSPGQASRWRTNNIAVSSPTSSQANVVIIGPIVCAGMEAAGTLQDVREFLRLLTDVRRRAGRRVTFILIHHENRAGKVSGAWEGATDTLLHVTLMGQGHTRLHIQKARWASDYHAQTINLTWTGQDAYQVEDKPELTDDDIAEQMLAVIAGNPRHRLDTRRGSHPRRPQCTTPSRPGQVARRRAAGQYRQTRRR